MPVVGKPKTSLLMALAVGLVAVGPESFASQAQPNLPEQRKNQVVTPVKVAGPIKLASSAKPGTDSFGDPLPSGALLRLGTLRHRLLDLFHHHTDLFRPHTEFLLDGQTALTETPDEVRWVDLASGRLLKSWPLPKGLTVAGFSADGRLTLLTDQKAFQLWDLTSRKLLRTFDAPSERASRTLVHFASDGKVVAVTRANGLVRVFDMATGRQLWHEGVIGSVLSTFPLGFLPDRKTVLFRHDKETITLVLRDRSTGRVLRSFETNLPSLQTGGAHQLSSDGKTVFFGTAGKAVRAWDVATGKELPSLGGHPRHANRVAISGDGKTVLTCGTFDRFVKIWDWPAAKQRGKIDLGTDRHPAPGGLRVSADGKRAAIIVYGDTAPRFFDLKTGMEAPSPAEAHRSTVNGLAIAADGKVVTAGNDNTIRVWDLRSGRQLREIPSGWLIGTRTLALSADGRQIASADYNSGKVLVHERDTGRVLHTIDTGGIHIWSVAFAPQKRLLAISGEKDRDVKRKCPIFPRRLGHRPRPRTMATELSPHLAGVQSRRAIPGR